MKIKRFKLKNDIIKDDLTSLGFKNGGSWIKEDAELFICKSFEYKRDGFERYPFEYSISVAFSSDINDWNDFDNVLILDEDFCQPYTPFYGDNYGKDINNFPVLEDVIFRYNEFMDSLGIFEEINGD